MSLSFDVLHMQNRALKVNEQRKNIKIVKLPQIQNKKPIIYIAPVLNNNITSFIPKNKLAAKNFAHLSSLGNNAIQEKKIISLQKIGPIIISVKKIAPTAQDNALARYVSPTPIKVGIKQPMILRAQKTAQRPAPKISIVSGQRKITMASIRTK